MKTAVLILLLSADVLAQGGGKLDAGRYAAHKLTQSYAKAATKVLIAIQHVDALASTSEAPDIQRVNDALSDAEVEATSDSDKQSFKKLNVFAQTFKVDAEDYRQALGAANAFEAAKDSGVIERIDNMRKAAESAREESWLNRDYTCIDPWKNELQMLDATTPDSCLEAIRVSATRNNPPTCPPNEARKWQNSEWTCTPVPQLR